MEKKEVVRNIMISANDFRFKEINNVEFEKAVKYYVDQLESVPLGGRVSQPSEPTEAGWIDIKKESPNEKTPFVAYDKDSCYPIVLAEWNLGEGYSVLGTQRSLRHITHWLKIPAPPKP